MEKNLADEINEGEALYLLSLTDKNGVLEAAVSVGYHAETDENTLDGESSAVLKSILEGADIVLPDYCTAFRIAFENPIAYQVTDESYTAFDDNQKIESGRLFAKLTKSSYLKFISDTTFTESFVKSFQHYRVCTVEKILDVISENEPKIEKIKNGW